MAAPDLHMHSLVSDGLLTPAALMQQQAQAGVQIVSLTDHDSTAGLPDAEQEAAKQGIRFIPGIELSTDWHGTSVDILGYGIDYTDQRLQETLAFHRERRYSRMEKMVASCCEAGMQVSMEDIEKKVTGDTYSRPHLAAVLVEKGYAVDVADAFDRFVGSGRPCYEKKAEEMTPDEAVRTIRQAGGAAVIAHPVYYGLDEEIRVWLQRGGADGMEVYHRDHTTEDQVRYASMIEGLPLLVTGGTDYHHDSFGRKGERIGDSPLPDRCAEQLLKHLEHVRGT
ncbi:PHP domain-containing protein [Alkalicoccus chagannorensis]|uniref:PHP domain-containing protein n=1 Tax=Alkalicoccus chagannorensis TaxID=427072 RepID=UPI0003F864E8|nr:PHP domain-containing protein [Alkalicoccus chagannorensis]